MGVTPQWIRNVWLPSMHLGLTSLSWHTISTRCWQRMNISCLGDGFKMHVLGAPRLLNKIGLNSMLECKSPSGGPTRQMEHQSAITPQSSGRVLSPAITSLSGNTSLVGLQKEMM